MPRGRHTTGPHLRLRPARPEKKQSAVWVIVDARHEESTGCGPADRAGAETALEGYLSRKHLSELGLINRAPRAIPVADVLALYAQRVGPKVARPKELATRIDKLLTFWGNRTLADVNGRTCREYAGRRALAAARRELEDLRSAIYLHRREGLCSEVVEVVLPEKSEPRDRWLTRSEAARLIRSAWRYREVQLGGRTIRASRKHVARFILVGLYTGTRAGAICGAALSQTPGHGWVDLDRGVFYRRPPGQKQTKKRQPAIPIPDELLAHMRRWKKNGQRFVVEWNGEPVKRISKAFAETVKAAGLGPDVTPHTLRHTSVTWSMQAATDPWQAAGYYGMTLETLRDHYGHHHPDFMGDARTAFRRMRGTRNYPRTTPAEMAD